MKAATSQELGQVRSVSRGDREFAESLFLNSEFNVPCLRVKISSSWMAL